MTLETFLADPNHMPSMVKQVGGCIVLAVVVGMLLVSLADYLSKSR